MQQVTQKQFNDLIYWALVAYRAAQIKDLCYRDGHGYVNTVSVYDVVEKMFRERFITVYGNVRYTFVSSKEVDAFIKTHIHGYLQKLQPNELTNSETFASYKSHVITELNAFFKNSAPLTYTYDDSKQLNLTNHHFNMYGAKIASGIILGMGGLGLMLFVMPHLSVPFLVLTMLLSMVLMTAGAMSVGYPMQAMEHQRNTLQRSGLSTNSFFSPSVVLNPEKGTLANDDKPVSASEPPALATI
jgi:hypothetical protein